MGAEQGALGESRLGVRGMASMATYVLSPLRRVLMLVECRLNRLDDPRSPDVDRLCLGRVVDILSLQLGILQFLRVLDNKVGVLRGGSREMDIAIEGDIVPEGL